MNTIALVASYGGHLSELRRMINQSDLKARGFEPLLITTKPTAACDLVIRDFNRNNFILGLGQFWQIARFIKKQKIDLIITTGAAPGLYFGLIGRLLGKKTIWIDSLANVDHLSMSAKIASLFFHQVYVQWEHLAKGKVKYIGCLL